MGLVQLPIFFVPVCLAPPDFPFFVSWHRLLQILAALSSIRSIISKFLSCPDNSVWFPVRPADAMESDKAGLETQLYHLSCEAWSSHGLPVSSSLQHLFSKVPSGVLPDTLTERTHPFLSNPYLASFFSKAVIAIRHLNVCIDMFIVCMCPTRS